MNRNLHVGLCLLAVLALALAACAPAPVTTATPGTGGLGTGTPGAVGTGSPGALGTGTPVAGATGTVTAGAFDQLAENLESAGATVEMGTAVTNPVFVTATEARTLMIDGAMATAYAFATAADATAAAGTVGANAATVGGTSVTWSATPHLYQSGRYIVVYEGEQTAVTEVLETAFGQPFAEGEG